MNSSVWNSWREQNHTKWGTSGTKNEMQAETSLVPDGSVRVASNQIRCTIEFALVRDPGVRGWHLGLQVRNGGTEGFRNCRIACTAGPPVQRTRRIEVVLWRPKHCEENHWYVGTCTTETNENRGVPLLQIPITKIGRRRGCLYPAIQFRSQPLRSYPDTVDKYPHESAGHIGMRAIMGCS